MLTISLFVIGLIIGSFLNVLALRFNTGLSILGRSSCASCGKRLRWRELIPVLSFVFLKGRCSRCLAKISWQYPFVEVLTGFIFATVFSLDVSSLQNILNLLVFSLFILIAVYDIRHKIIPNKLVYVSVVLALAVRVISNNQVLDWWAGPILFVFFVGLWFVTRGRAIGFGDSKLALAIGLLLGGAQGFSAVVLAFWIGALFGLLLIALNHLSPLLTHTKKITMKSEIPFAPFLILGAWLALIFQLDLIHVSLF